MHELKCFSVAVCILLLCLIFNLQNKFQSVILILCVILPNTLNTSACFSFGIFKMEMVYKGSPVVYFHSYSGFPQWESIMKERQLQGNNSYSMAEVISKLVSINFHILRWEKLHLGAYMPAENIIESQCKPEWLLLL